MQRWNLQAGGLEEEQSRRFMDKVKDNIKLFDVKEKSKIGGR